MQSECQERDSKKEVRRALRPRACPRGVERPPPLPPAPSQAPPVDGARRAGGGGPEGGRGGPGGGGRGAGGGVWGKMARRGGEGGAGRGARGGGGGWEDLEGGEVALLAGLAVRECLGRGAFGEARAPGTSRPVGRLPARCPVPC